MKVICIFLSLFLIFSCATKHKTKQIEKITELSEQSFVSDSLLEVQYQRKTYDFLTNISSSENLMQKLGLSFSGKSNEDEGLVTLTQTNNGFELGMKGAINMALDQSLTKNKTLSQKEIMSVVDSVYNARFYQEIQKSEKRLFDSLKLDKEKQSFEFSFWIYAVVGGLLLVGLVTYMKMKK